MEKVYVEIHPLQGDRMTLMDAKRMGADIHAEGYGYRYFADEQSAIEWAETMQLKKFAKSYECKVLDDTYFFIPQLIIVMI